MPERRETEGKRNSSLAAALVVSAIELVIVVGASYLLSGYVSKMMGQNQLERAGNSEAKRRLEEILERRFGKQIELNNLSSYETLIVIAYSAKRVSGRVPPSR
jgi:hypothetical protein